MRACAGIAPRVVLRFALLHKIAPHTAARTMAPGNWRPLWRLAAAGAPLAGLPQECRTAAGGAARAVPGAGRGGASPGRDEFPSNFAFTVKMNATELESRAAPVMHLTRIATCSINEEIYRLHSATDAEFGPRSHWI